MTDQEKRLKFIESILEKYPGYKIISFTTICKPMTIESPTGVRYTKNSANRFLSHNIRFDAIADKPQYIQSQLDNMNTGLTLIEYKGVKAKVVVKDKNGFTYSPQCYDLLQGHPVSIQTCDQKEELFKYKASLKHNYKYDYGNFIYTNGKQKIPVICKIHGVFYVACERHLHGNGCPGCKADNASYKISDWIAKYKNKECTFYIIEFINDIETFVKIGITSKSIKHRYRGYTNYKYKVLLEIKGNSDFIGNLEKKILAKYSKYKYSPKNKFEGRTECFNIKIKKIIYEQFNI